MTYRVHRLTLNLLIQNALMSPSSDKATKIISRSKSRQNSEMDVIAETWKIV